MKEVKIGLVGFEAESINKGVEALFYSTMNVLTDVELRNNVKYKYYLLDGLHPSKNIILDIHKRKIDITHLANLNFSSLKSFIKSLFYLDQLKYYAKLDYVLDIGLGDSFSDIYGIERFRLINFPKTLFRLLSKKLIILPQTIGPFLNEEVIKSANYSIEKSDFVMARDKISYEYVIANTKQKKVAELIDMAFFLPYKKVSLNDRKLIHVGLGISDLLWRGGYTADNQFKLKLNYQNFIRSIIQYFTAQNNVQLHLVPHVVSGKAFSECDYKLSYNLRQEFVDTNIILSPFFIDPIMAKSYIASLDFFCGSRMHACIASFSSGVPTFPIAYSRKFNGLFRDTLNYGYMGDMVNEDESIIFKNLVSAFTQIEELKLLIQERMETVVNDRYGVLISELAEIIR